MIWEFSQHLRCPSLSLILDPDLSWPGPSWSGLHHLQHHWSDSQDCSGMKNSVCRPICLAYLLDNRAASLKYLFLNSELRILTNVRIPNTLLVWVWHEILSRTHHRILSQSCLNLMLRSNATTMIADPFHPMFSEIMIFELIQSSQKYHHRAWKFVSNKGGWCVRGCRICMYMPNTFGPRVPQFWRNFFGASVHKKIEI